MIPFERMFESVFFTQIFISSERMLQREHQMGLLCDVFASSPDQALAYADSDEDTRARYLRVQSGRFTALEFGTLWAILSGVAFDFDRHEFPSVTDMSGQEDFPENGIVEHMPADFVRLVANAHEPSLRAAANAWAQTEELEGAEPDDLYAFLKELSALARQTQAKGLQLYIWNQL
jgi:hypothetical protein